MELLAVTRRDAVGLLHFVWWRSLSYAPAGDLSDFTDGQIARWADWDGDPGHLVSALKTAGFLDAQRTLHDWHDYAGRWLERRQADADRKRRARAAPNGDPRMSGGRPAGRRPESGVPDLTGPDLTGPDLTQPGPIPNPSPQAGKGSGRPGRVTTLSRDVVDRLASLDPELGAAEFQDAAEDALTAIGFACSREVFVDDRGDGDRGRVDLVAERGGERIGVELDNRSPRQTSIQKLSQTHDMLRVVVLRGPFSGRPPAGLDAVIGNRQGRARGAAGPGRQPALCPAGCSTTNHGGAGGLVELAEHWTAGMGVTPGEGWERFAQRHGRWPHADEAPEALLAAQRSRRLPAVPEDAHAPG